ncbi:MAG: hypothetical protein FJ405_13050 [Verrucomicrobia bacterium]|nr:hypothetical protein [Verrucomicrobiota bacterium]
MCNSHTTLLPRWLILLLVHFSANLESTSGASSSPGSGPSFTIKVLDLNSTPVEGAEVLTPDYSASGPAAQPSVHSWKTDASGTASVSLVGNMLSQHAVAFWIRHSNHAPAQMILSSNPKPLGKLQIPSQTVQLRKGITVGGVVLDPGGKAVPNAKIEVWGQEKTPERSDKGDGFSVLIGHSLNRHSGLHVTTDSYGRWVTHQFPKDVSEVYLDIIRPDGGFGLFSPVSASALFGVRTAGSFSSEDLRNTNAILRFPKGETVRGRVLDWQGKPRAGARITELVGGFSARQTWETQSDAKGEFELKDRSHDLGIVMVEAEGAAAASARFGLPRQAAKTLEIQLHPRSPLKLQLLGTNGLPLAGAQVAHAEHRSKVAIPWSATADAQGRVEWIAAPASVLALSVFAPHHAFRTFRVKPDGSLKSLHLPAELDRNVRIKVKAIEAPPRNQSRASPSSEPMATTPSSLESPKMHRTSISYSIRMRHPSRAFLSSPLRFERRVSVGGALTGCTPMKALLSWRRSWIGWLSSRQRPCSPGASQPWASSY